MHERDREDCCNKNEKVLVVHPTAHLVFAKRNPFHVVVAESLHPFLEIPTVNTVLDRVASREHKPGKGIEKRATRAQVSSSWAESVWNTRFIACSSSSSEYIA